MRNGDVRRQHAGRGVARGQYTTARRIQLRGLGFKRYAQRTISGNLEGMPALQAGFYGDKERPFLAAGEG